MEIETIYGGNQEWLLNNSLELRAASDHQAERLQLGSSRSGLTAGSRLQCVLATFFVSNTDRLIDARAKNLSVAYFAGLGSGHNRTLYFFD